MNRTLAYSLSSTALIFPLVFSPVVVSSKPPIANQTNQVNQAKRQQALNREFYDLIIKGNSSISGLQASVKDLTYAQEFAENLIFIGGKQAYAQSLERKKKDVVKDIQEIKQAQQQLREFITDHQEFMLSLEPQVRQQVVPILNINIPRRMKVWQAEQHELNEKWKCSTVKTAPVCY